MRAGDAGRYALALSMLIEGESLMKSLLIVLICCVSIAAQSRDEFHRKYGKPMSETYEVRPGIYVTATSNKEGDVCQIVISPQPASETLDYPSTKTMRSDALTSIIDELVPPQSRGKQTLSGFFNATCLPLNNCVGTMDNYERVRIFHNGGMDKERYAFITFVKPTCPK